MRQLDVLNIRNLTIFGCDDGRFSSVPVKIISSSASEEFLNLLSLKTGCRPIGTRLLPHFHGKPVNPNQSTSFQTCVLIALTVFVIGCPSRAHMAKAPNYSTMTDVGEVHSSDGEASSAVLASASRNNPNSQESALNFQWYYIVPFVAVILLGAAFAFKKRSSASVDAAAPDEPSSEKESEQTAAALPATTEDDDSSITDSQFSTATNIMIDDFEDGDSDWSESEIELDSVVLLDDEEEELANQTGAMTAVVETPTGNLPESHLENKLQQLRRANESARVNLENALTKIGKLKSKLREKINLVERPQSAACELDENSLDGLSNEQLREHLISVSAGHQHTREQLEYLEDRNAKLKSKLREKVELIEVLRGSQQDETNESDIAEMTIEELREKLTVYQKERADLKAELNHVVQWNVKLKKKLIEKLENIGGQTVPSEPAN